MESPTQETRPHRQETGRAKSPREMALRERVDALESALLNESRQRAELIHLVSHELRTPISVITGFARLLREPGNQPVEPSAGDDYVDEILKAARKLDAFVGELIEVGPEAGDLLSVMPAPAHLDTVIEGVVQALSPGFEERAIEVILRLDESLPRFAFDSGRIEQVLTNLMTNALRYGRAGGTVRIESEKTLCSDVAFARISIEDDGPGIDPSDRERIFAPYMRGAVPDGCDGLGIGLSICRRILDAHGGAIEVLAGREGGACFAFYLPLTNAAMQG